MTKDLIQHVRKKHIEIDHHFTKERVLFKELKLVIVLF